MINFFTGVYIGIAIGAISTLVACIVAIRTVRKIRRTKIPAAPLLNPDLTEEQR